MKLAFTIFLALFLTLSTIKGEGEQKGWRVIKRGEGEMEVEAKGAHWMRISMNAILPPHSHLLLFSPSFPSYTQRLDSFFLTQVWNNSTAYFNGDRVIIKLIKEDHPLKIKFGESLHERFRKPQLTFETSPDPIISIEGVEWDNNNNNNNNEGEREGGEEKSICYSPDTRVFSNDTRQGRYIYGDVNGCCTAWLIDDGEGCFLSAGHCTDLGRSTVQFNVPLSAEDGTLVHPPPADQYVVDQLSMASSYVGVVDWRYFGVNLNTETGLHPLEAYSGEYYKIQRTPSYPPVGSKITIIGYGENESFPKTHRRVQKTASGSYSGQGGIQISYRVDTSNGNSGSAVFNEDTGLAIGIHTLGGCRVSSPSSANSGVDIFTPSLQEALAHPKGVCAPRRR